MQSNIIYSDNFKDLPIQTDRQRNLGCRRYILNKLYDLFDYYTQKHNKVLFIRFDLTFPDDRKYPDDNSSFEGFLANFIKNRKRKALDREGFDPYYLWVREATYDNSPNHHYHCILLLDGNKTRKIHHHLAKAEELWNRALGLPYTERSGLIDYCLKDRYGNPQENGIMLLREDRGFQQQLMRCFHWGSYLAKVNSKGNVGSNVREMGCSQLPDYNSSLWQGSKVYSQVNVIYPNRLDYSRSPCKERRTLCIYSRLPFYISFKCSCSRPRKNC